MNGDRGYNNTSGGSLNKHMSDEAKRKLSESRKGKYAGEKNPMYGRSIPCPEEKKKKLSEMMSGSGNPMYGVHLHPTDEQRQQASLRFTGAGNPFYGKKHTDESRRKISASRKNKKPVRCVETGVEYDSCCDVERQTGFDKAHIQACCKGRAHTAYGFHWEYIA